MRNIISKTDALLVLESINECVICRDADGANRVLGRLQQLLEIDNAVYGLAKLDSTGNLKSYEILNMSYPQEWLDLYTRNGFHQVDPISKENFCNYELQFWEETYKKYNCSKEFIAASKEYNLHNGFAFGIRNPKGTDGSLFSIAGKLNNHPRNRFVLKNLAPHLHNAFHSVLSSTKAQYFDLSKREKEVLNWIKVGKSSWDISVILSISERTVKFHVDNLMAKLNAVSRTHAVAIALSAGVIDFG
jgi:LuxR family transcriptional regulator, quorum-sensing system regulator CviR